MEIKLESGEVAETELESIVESGDDRRWYWGAEDAQLL
jgi:hypothetical protein